MAREVFFRADTLSRTRHLSCKFCDADYNGTLWNRPESSGDSRCEQLKDKFWRWLQQWNQESLEFHGEKKRGHISSITGKSRPSHPSSQAIPLFSSLLSGRKPYFSCRMRRSCHFFDPITSSDTSRRLKYHLKIWSTKRCYYTNISCTTNSFARVLICASPPPPKWPCTRFSSWLNVLSNHRNGTRKRWLVSEWKASTYGRPANETRTFTITAHGRI